MENNVIVKPVQWSLSVGEKIRIIDMVGEPQYNGKSGTITDIDDMGQVHGTWGGLAVIPDEDMYEVIANPDDRAAIKADEDDFYHIYDTKSGDKIYIAKGKE
jgi:hypothetical protein